MRVFTDSACLNFDCRQPLIMTKAVGPCWWYECSSCGAKCTEVQGIDGVIRWRDERGRR